MPINANENFGDGIIIKQVPPGSHLPPAPPSGTKPAAKQPNKATNHGVKPELKKPDPKKAEPPKPVETLTQAITRMFRQGKTSHEIAGQIQRWHPNWSQDQIKTAITNAPKPKDPLWIPPPHGKEPSSPARPGAVTQRLPALLDMLIAKNRPRGMYYTRRADLMLRPGQTAGFTPGRGYYARTATRVARPSTHPSVTPPGHQRDPQGNGASSADTKSISTQRADFASKEIVKKRGESPVHVAVSTGLSRKPHVVAIRWTKLGKVIVTEHASASVSWSGGGAGARVTLDPKGGVSVNDKRLTIRDDGFLHGITRGVRHDPTFVADLVIQRDKVPLPLGDAYKVKISIGHKQLEASVRSIDVEASLKFEHGYPAVELKTSTALEIHTPSGVVKATYAITTSVTLERRLDVRVPPDLVPVLTAAAAGLVLVGTSAILRPKPEKPEPAIIGG